MKTLQEIESEVIALAQKIGASKAHLPGFGSSLEDGKPFVEVGAGQYHYVVEERGEELRRDSSSDWQALLYWIFADVTHQMAFEWELAHRVANQDSRRTGFARQLELLGGIDPVMAQRRAGEIEGILRGAPYNH